MKKLFAIVLCLTLALSLCACGATDSTDGSGSGKTAKETTTTIAKNSTEENSTENTDKDFDGNTDGNTDEDSVVNEFYNPNNNYYDEGAVSVRPGYVYWEGDTLVAECFVINGVNRPVSNITVKELSLSNDAGVIASAGFGELQDLVLSPYTHYVWTFRFAADCITQMNGDLTSLECYSSVSFNS